MKKAVWVVLAFIAVFVGVIVYAFCQAVGTEFTVSFFK